VVVVVRARSVLTEVRARLVLRAQGPCVPSRRRQAHFSAHGNGYGFHSQLGINTGADLRSFDCSLLSIIWPFLFAFF